jgi:calcineurin-like phosphoesterase family protein
MNTFVTSDLHFGHTNIMKFCPDTRARFNNDVDYMTEAMIEEWNHKVKDGDLVYILGDVAFCSAEKARKIMDRLNGRKILVQGNHDSKLVKDPGFCAKFEEIHVYHEINHNGVKVCMFHYPISEWNQMHRGAVHLYGHLHGGESGLEKYRAMDVGMDATGETVSRLDAIITRALAKEIKTHHGKLENA